MGLFNNRHGSRSDVVVTLFALLAIVLAGGISIATISTEKQADPFGAEDLSLTDPVGKAETAALAGIDAARGHIECHGITESGGLPGQYYANGARFEVAWDKINLADSTVHIVSTGFMSQDDGKIFSSIIESVHKIDFLASHDRPVLHEYYQGNAQPTHFNSSN
ncbi:MAG: hypothetical protein GY839_02500 [candidate division Zixibacteria bacterium]|nr:hypothetical protein [candidate division Zixibacteria bacterium]